MNHFHNHTYRARPVPEVVQEIRSLEARFVCFVDDNIFANFGHAKSLFQALIPLKLKWLGQGTITAAEDPELMALARRSGCVGMLVGIESISQSALESVHKTGNQADRYRRNLEVYKKNGIDVNASLVFGFDGEGPDVFNSTYRFLMENRIPFAGLQPRGLHPILPYTRGSNPRGGSKRKSGG